MLASWRNPIVRIAAAQDGRPSSASRRMKKPKRVSWEKPVADTGEKRRVWAVPCDCTGSDRAARTMARARIPRRYEHCDFDNFDTDLYEPAVNPPHGIAASNNLSSSSKRLLATIQSELRQACY